MAYRVVLDYGHGGSKAGAVFDDVQEKALNLILGERIRTALKQQVPAGKKVDVLLTRDEDYDIPLSARFGLINEHHRRTPIDLVVSVHHNAAGTTLAKGFETYINEGNSLTRAHARAIANKLSEQGFRLRNGGVLTTAQLGRRLAMIHKTAPPSILIEAGYITNPEDFSLVTDPAKQGQMATAIAEGIWSVLIQEAPSHG